MTYLPFKAFLLLLTLVSGVFSSIYASAADKVCNEDAMTSSKHHLTTDVLVCHDNQWVNLTHFKTANKVFDWKLSTDKQLAYVWYHEEYPPRKMNVYQIPSSKLISRFYPGWGGRVVWTYYNTILFRHGCGTSCNATRIYNPSGELLYANATTSNAISPDHKMIITFPYQDGFQDTVTLNKPVVLNESNQSLAANTVFIAVVRDLAKGEVIYVYRNLRGTDGMLDATWDTNNEVTITYDGPVKKMPIASLKIDTQ